MRTVSQRHVYTASVPKLFQTIEWALLILCQKVRKNPVFKSNTGFSVAPPVGLEPTTHGLTVRRSTD